MKILLLHNYYRTSAPSGEDRIVDIERSILRRLTTWNVRDCTKFNDDTNGLSWSGMISLALKIPWNRAAVKQVRGLVRNYKPDILHAHNVFPQFSPAIFAPLLIHRPLLF